jgi:hypothetical protein
MKSIYALVATSSLALLAACDQGGLGASKVPTQAEKIEAFCKEAASLAYTSSNRVYMQTVQEKILAEEWDPDTVYGVCAKALERKTDFVRKHSQPQPVQGNPQ